MTLRNNFLNIAENRLQTIQDLGGKRPITTALLNRQLKSVRHLIRELKESLPNNVNNTADEFNFVQNLTWRDLKIVKAQPMAEKEGKQTELIPLLSDSLEKVIGYTQKALS